MQKIILLLPTVLGNIPDLHRKQQFRKPDMIPHDTNGPISGGIISLSVCHFVLEGKRREFVWHLVWPRTSFPVQLWSCIVLWLVQFPSLSWQNTMMEAQWNTSHSDWSICVILYQIQPSDWLLAIWARYLYITLVCCIVINVVFIESHCTVYYIVIIIAEFFPPTAHALIGWFEVTWHLTIKLFRAKSLWVGNIAKSMTTTIARFSFCTIWQITWWLVPLETVNFVSLKSQCFPWLCLRETLGFSGNEINCFQRDQSLSVYCMQMCTGIPMETPSF